MLACVVDRECHQCTHGFRTQSQYTVANFQNHIGFLSSASPYFIYLTNYFSRLVTSFQAAVLCDTIIGPSAVLLRYYCLVVVWTLLQLPVPSSSATGTNQDWLA